MKLLRYFNFRDVIVLNNGFTHQKKGLYLFNQCFEIQNTFKHVFKWNQSQNFKSFKKSNVHAMMKFQIWIECLTNDNTFHFDWLINLHMETDFYLTSGFVILRFFCECCVTLYCFIKILRTEENWSNGMYKVGL